MFLFQVEMHRFILVRRGVVVTQRDDLDILVCNIRQAVSKTWYVFRTIIPKRGSNLHEV